jgi:hypothetical protein
VVMAWGSRAGQLVPAREMALLAGGNDRVVDQGAGAFGVALLGLKVGA